MTETDPNPPARHPARRPARRPGFTLVELLVVIGIIALLIAILLPSLAAARRSANLVVCQATLRELNNVGLMFQTDHNGFLPVGGYMNFGLTPQSMGDPSQRRDVYMTANGQTKPAPLPAALSRYFGKPVRTDSPAAMQADFDLPGGIQKHFQCRAVDQRADVSRYMEDAGYIYPMLPADYGFNEAILAISNSPSVHRLSGNLRRIQRGASDYMLFADARARTEFAPAGSQFVTFYNSGAEDRTLADCFNFDNAGTPSLFDTRRHRNRMNVLFVDGHVESLLITAANGSGPSDDLKRAYVYKAGGF